MKVMDEINGWSGKPKELVAFLTENVEKNTNLFPQLIEILQSGSDVQKGTVADAMKHVSKNKPEIVAPYIDKIVNFIDYKAPRVKWGVPETIGNLAKKYPAEVEVAIPKLLANTKDESTVVRWCAAFALGEISKSNCEARKMLIPKIEEILENEKNNGVKNVYLKALKSISCGKIK